MTNNKIKNQAFRQATGHCSRLQSTVHRYSQSLFIRSRGQIQLTHALHFFYTHFASARSFIPLYHDVRPVVCHEVVLNCSCTDTTDDQQVVIANVQIFISDQMKFVYLRQFAAVTCECGQILDFEQINNANRNSSRFVILSLLTFLKVLK